MSGVNTLKADEHFASKSHMQPLKLTPIPRPTNFKGSLRRPVETINKGALSLSDDSDDSDGSTNTTGVQQVPPDRFVSVRSPKPGQHRPANATPKLACQEAPAHAGARLVLTSHAEAQRLKQAYTGSHIVKINDGKSAILFAEQIEDWNALVSVLQVRITRRVKKHRLSLTNPASTRDVLFIPKVVTTSIGAVPCLIILAIGVLQGTTALPSRLAAAVFTETLSFLVKLLQTSIGIVGETPISLGSFDQIYLGKSAVPQNPDVIPMGPGEDLQSRACSIVASKLQLNASSVQYHSGFISDDGIEHAYLRQAHDGIPFINAVANVAIKPFEDDDSVLSFGSSFVQANRIAPSKPSISLSATIPELEEMFDGKYNQRLRLAYAVRPDDSAALVYGIQIQNLEENTWYEVFVDAHTGQLVSVTDFGAKATAGTYRAVPIHKHSIADGTEWIVHPEDLEASPYGWHQNRTMLSTGTLGNNVVAWFGSDVWDGATYRTNWDDDDWEVVEFDYPYDQTIAPTTTENRDAAITNAFYVGNVVHDFAWR
ncbi:hypothetical protein MD484_g6006, partial [Candolleomyces efflorescens]